MKITMLLMGKSTISTGPFSIANCNKLPEGNYNVVIMYVYIVRIYEIMFVHHDSRVFTWIS
jgi:hypothetical protein